MTFAIDSQTQAASHDIGIVTAFFDIGRGEWTKEKGYPEHLHRTTEAYFAQFAHLASLDNELVVYTSEDLAPKIRQLRAGKEDKTVVVPVPLSSMFHDRLEAIRRVQANPDFLKRINPSQVRNPEYWSAEYVLVMSLKAFFVTHAVQNNLLSGPQVAWVDFGYCRTREALGGASKWQYAFTPGKISLFIFGGAYDPSVSIAEIIANNITYIAGGVIVAEKPLWVILAQLYQTAMQELLQRDLVDDDQTLLLLSTLYRPDLFEQRVITADDWLMLLKKFNMNATGA